MINKLEEIRQASGNEKLEILSKYPELKEILKACYDPHKKYYMTALGHYGQDAGIVKGWDMDWKIIIRILDSLSDRTLSGNHAKEIVAHAIIQMNDDSAQIFQGIINKDLRLGLGVSSINKVWPRLIPTMEDGEEAFKIMYVKNFKKGKLQYPLLVAQKLDGVRARFVNGKLYSRQRKVFVGLDHIETYLDQLCERLDMPKDFDGELIVPGEIFDVASGVIRSDNPTPEAVFSIFDIPGDDRIKSARLQRMENLIASLDPFCKVEIIKHQWVRDEAELQMAYDAYVIAGYEGIVIYDPNSYYEDHTPTRRTDSWMRIVPLKTADCKVIGFFEGKGKYKGSLGGITVDYKGHEVKVGTGFAEIEWQDLPHSKKKKMNGEDVTVHTDTVRSHIWRNQGIYLGWIAECEFKEETKAGALRQPRFKCWRYDKTEPNFS